MSKEFDPIPAAARQFYDAMDRLDDAHEAAYDDARNAFSDACQKRDAGTELAGRTLGAIAAEIVDGHGLFDDMLDVILDHAHNGGVYGIKASNLLKKLAEKYAQEVACEVTA